MVSIHGYPFSETTISSNELRSEVSDSKNPRNQSARNIFMYLVHYAGYSLTGRDVVSVEEVKNKMRECSLAMGLRQQTWLSNEPVIDSVATNLTLYLNALGSIIPQHFLSSYRSPCWRSPIVLSNKQQKELKHKKFNENLYQSIFQPLLHIEEGSLMCLPAFFVAGFPKSGTTTLHSVLLKNEMILDGLPKEPHWWTRMPLDYKDPNYLRLATLLYIQYYYNPANSQINKNPQLLAYDGSQSRLYDSNFSVDNEDYCAMPIAVSHILPSVKFIVVMRNPVERIFSHYKFYCTKRHLEPPPSSVFHENVIANVNFFRECLSKKDTIYECANDKQFSQPQPRGSGCGEVSFHLITSIYYLHLKKWMQFFPRENFLFLRTNDMSSQPSIFMKNVTDFLNINQMPDHTANLLTHMVNVQELHMEMLPETRAILSEFYGPFNEMLVELIGDRRFLWEDM